MEAEAEMEREKERAKVRDQLERKTLREWDQVARSMRTMLMALTRRAALAPLRLVAPEVELSPKVEVIKARAQAMGARPEAIKARGARENRRRVEALLLQTRNRKANIPNRTLIATSR